MAHRLGGMAMPPPQRAMLAAGKCLAGPAVALLPFVSGPRRERQ
jgi:hypothetical protein